ncbi:MAG TPA: penicillin acylase family protein, partial [Puia sp.]|nr:penicillin acylase family protein [Puia sp.]
NIMYADRYDTIFFISNGKIPIRNPDPQYNWKSTVRGDTSATLWTQFKPVTALPQYLNPSSGYLFNTNHSPFLATDPADNLDPSHFDRNDGYEMYQNNRSARFMELMKDVGKMDYKSFREIKFDRQLPRRLRYHFGIDSLSHLNASDYPALQELMLNLQQWDHRAVADSRGAAIFLLMYEHIAETKKGEPSRELSRAELLEAFQYIHDYMEKYFGSTHPALGDIQKLVRGDEVRPAGGLPDVMAAAYTDPYVNGTRKVVSGDAYICLVRYRKNGLPLIESINTFGASTHPDSPHFRDQLPLFLQQKTKPMTLDKEEVLRKAERIYHPGS